MALRIADDSKIAMDPSSTAKVGCAAASAVGARTRLEPIGEGKLRYWVDFWELARARVVATVDAKNVVTAMRFSRDGRRLFAACMRELVVFEVASGAELVRRRAHDHSIKVLASSPDDTLLATGGQDGRLVVWRASSLEVIHRIDAHEAWLHDAAVASDGTLASAGLNESLAIFAPDGTLRAREPWRTTALDIAGRDLAAAGYEGLRLLDLDTLVERWSRPLSVPFRTVAFSPSGAQLAAVEFFGDLVLLDATTGRETERLAGLPSSATTSLSWEDETSLVLCAGDSHRLRIRRAARPLLRAVD